MNNISFSKELIKLVESTFLETKNNEKIEDVQVGDIVKIEYKCKKAFRSNRKSQSFKT
jgi:ribosomal protein L19